MLSGCIWFVLQIHKSVSLEKEFQVSWKAQWHLYSLLVRYTQGEGCFTKWATLLLRVFCNCITLSFLYTPGLIQLVLLIQNRGDMK